METSFAPMDPDVLARIPQFVTSDTMTVDGMLASFPAGSAYRGKYIRVSDYGGFVDRVLRCDYEAGSGLYFWTPTTPDYGRSITLTGDMTLYRLKSPSSVVISGSIALGVTRNVTIDVANGRPGEIIEIKNSMTSILGSLNILGSVGSGLSQFLFNTLGGYSRYLIDSSSGTLQLIRLQ